MANNTLDPITSHLPILDSLHSLVGISLDTIEKATRHHLTSHRRIIERQFDQSKELLDNKVSPAPLSLNGKFFQPSLDNSIDYLRGLHDISNETLDRYIELLERTQGEQNKYISTILNWHSKFSGHNEATIAAARSAISAANSAFENAHNTVRQVASIAHASVKAATQATSDTIEAATPARRKAA